MLNQCLLKERREQGSAELNVTHRDQRILLGHDIAWKIETPILRGPVRTVHPPPIPFQFLPAYYTFLFAPCAGPMVCLAFHFHRAFAYTYSPAYSSISSALCCPPYLVTVHTQHLWFTLLTSLMLQLKSHFLWGAFCDPPG